MTTKTAPPEPAAASAEDEELANRAAAAFNESLRRGILAARKEARMELPKTIFDVQHIPLFAKEDR